MSARDAVQTWAPRAAAAAVSVAIVEVALVVTTLPAAASDGLGLLALWAATTSALALPAAAGALLGAALEASALGRRLGMPQPETLLTALIIGASAAAAVIWLEALQRSHPGLDPSRSASCASSRRG